MATFEFTSPEGKKFELEGPEGSTQEQAFQKFQEMRPELFSSKKEKPEKKGFVERFGETFQPVKAITEEGIVPQLGQYVKRKVTGEPAPKTEERPERPISTKESFNQVVNFAKQDPGAFVGTLANAIVADPELLFVPEFLPARIASAIEKTTKLGAAAAKTADAATQAAAMAAAQSAARQLNERGTVDMNVLRSEAQNAAAMGGAARAVGETARYVAPGAKKYASEGTQDLLKRAREKGYTLPIGEMSPVGAIIDKYYQSPLRNINSAKFNKEITAPTGTSVSEINAKTFPAIEKNLDTEVTNALKGETIYVPSSSADILSQFLPYQKGSIQQSLSDIKNGVPLTAVQWHEIRQGLGKRRQSALSSNDGVMAEDIKNLIDGWDNIASYPGNLSKKSQEAFNVWKQHYTAFKDIDDAILSNKTVYDKYLTGSVDPKDIMSSIRQRRESEARQPFGAKTRAQTETAALASGLNLLGKENIPTTFFGALPKVATGALAKPVQALGYTPPGQFALYYGAPFTGVAPKAGYALEKTVEQGNK